MLLCSFTQSRLRVIERKKIQTQLTCIAFPEKVTDVITNSIAIMSERIWKEKIVCAKNAI